MKKGGKTSVSLSSPLPSPDSTVKFKSTAKKLIPRKKITRRETETSELKPVASLIRIEASYYHQCPDLHSAEGLLLGMLLDPYYAVDISSVSWHTPWVHVPSQQNDDDHVYFSEFYFYSFTGLRLGRRNATTLRHYQILNSDTWIMAIWVWSYLQMENRVE